MANEVAQSEGYAISQRKRKLIEQGFGWAKFVGPIRQVMVRGVKKVDQLSLLTMAAYNLVRTRTLAEVRPLASQSGNESRKRALEAGKRRQHGACSVEIPQSPTSGHRMTAACLVLQQYAQKVELYRRMCEDLHGAVPGPVPSFAGLIDALKAAATHRNLVVHADWTNSDVEGYTFTKVQIKNGGMMQEYAQLTVESMEKVCNEMTATLEQLHAYLTERDELLGPRPPT